MPDQTMKPCREAFKKLRSPNRFNGCNDQWWFEAGWQAAKADTADRPSEIRVFGLSVEEIARLKSWFENKSGNNITEFWEEAFNAGVKTARFMSKPEPVSVDLRAAREEVLRVEREAMKDGKSGATAIDIAKACAEAWGLKWE